MRIFRNYISKSRLKGQNDILHKENAELKKVNQLLRDNLKQEEFAKALRGMETKHLRGKLILEDGMPIKFAKEKLSFMLAEQFINRGCATNEIVDEMGNRVMIMDIEIVERR